MTAAPPSPPAPWAEKSRATPAPEKRRERVIAHGSDRLTLGDATDQFDGVVEDGAACPCCGRWGKVYKRLINRTMGQALLWLVKAAGQGRTWVDVPETGPKWLLRSNQLSILRWWGLVERRHPDLHGRDVKYRGYWRSTRKGVNFAMGKIKVPRAVFTWDGEPICFSTDDFVGIEDTENEVFSYTETMASARS